MTKQRGEEYQGFHDSIFNLAIKSLEKQMPEGLVKEKSKGDFEDCILYKCQICGGESEEICEGIKLKRPYWCNYCPYYKKNRQEDERMRGCGEMKNDRLIEMLREEADMKESVG